MNPENRLSKGTSGITLKNYRMISKVRRRRRKRRYIRRGRR